MIRQLWPLGHAAHHCAGPLKESLKKLPPRLVPHVPVVEVANGHVRLIKVWLAQGAVAKKWADLRGLDSAAPTLFDDPTEH